ncbi:cuticle protein 1-like [Ischnura elegans]|uniref:cuticle protein 1-like n=1 Tax=Ischnura elegans TaxID=197161 RepID=UPI001ED8B35F|nr:cuticle protein 1-like [Ischnura elegans]
MAVKLIVLALCVAVAMGGGAPGARYPAGVNPHACPNYPYCNNAALAAYASGHHGAVAPYAAPAYAAYGHHGAGVHGAAAAYPAGVTPHTCPNYPYCGPTPAKKWSGAAPAYGGGHGWAGSHAAPVWGHAGAYGGQQGPAPARYPAGVSPHACPNYPYCH